MQRSKAPPISHNITAIPSAEYAFNNKKYPNVFIAYRGYGDFEQDPLAHGIVGVASQQMKEICYNCVDKTRAFQSSRRCYPNPDQLQQLCKIAEMNPTTNHQYHDVYAALSAKGFDALGGTIHRM